MLSTASAPVITSYFCIPEVDYKNPKKLLIHRAIFSNHSREKKLVSKEGAALLLTARAHTGSQAELVGNFL